MALTKISRGLLNTGVADSSDATFLTVDSSEAATFAGNLTVSGNLTVTGTSTTVDTVTMNAQNAVVFEGATADAYETTLSIVDPTSSDKTQYLLNQTGYIPLLAASTTTTITSTPAELNILDGGTSATGTTLADADRLVVNDNGTMVQVALTDLETYMETSLDTLSNVTSLGTLTYLTVDNLGINGNTITANSGALNLTPASGSAIVLDGTINVDAGVVTGATSITSTALVGALTGNASTATALASARTIGGTSFDGTANIAVGLAATATALATARTIGGTSFDGTANIAVGLAATATALASARTIGGTSFDGTANIVPGTATEATNVTASANNSTDETVYPTFVDGATGTRGIETDNGLTYNPSTGVLTAGQFTGTFVGDIQGNASGTAATVTGAAQSAITSLGTLTGLTGGTGDFNWDSNTLFVDSSASMVGIGTSSPAVELHVDQAAGQITEIRASAATVYSKLIADDATGSNVLDFSHTLYVKEAGATIGTLAAGNWSLPNKLGVGNTDLLAACITATDTTARAPATSGNVTGHVVLGKKADSSLAMGSYSTGGYSWLQAAAADSAGTVNKLVLNPIGGNVGIGGTPGVLFDIQGGSGGDEVIRFGGSGTTDNRGLGLDLSGATYELSIGYPSHGTGRFAIGTWDRTTFSEKFCIDTSSGNVGIGMGNNGVPAYLLDVAGTVDVNNLLINTAQGTDGQVLTSTGSGVGWEDAGSSGASDIDGLSDGVSGITNFTNSLILGHQTTGTLSSAERNTALGYGSMQSITSADDTVAVGYNAGKKVTSGTKNVMVGAYSGLQTVDPMTGTENVCIGYESGYNVGSGAGNVLMGTKSGYNLNNDESNTMIGHEAGYYHAGGPNTFVGKYAGRGTTGTSGSLHNVAVGVNALQAINGGDYNVAVGNYAADAIASGHSNVAVGYGAQGADNSGYYNTVVGYNALKTQVNGGHTNTVIGYNAAKSATIGTQNVFLGARAAENQAGTGHKNTILGHYTASSLITGDQNIIIGSDCNVSASFSNNQYVMGYNVTSAGNGNFTFGSGTTDSNIVNGATSITAPSDIRLKEDIQDEVVGLDFINELRPVTFRWKKEKDVPEELVAHGSGSEKRVMNGKYNHGFISQEVKEVIDNNPNIKEGFDMWYEDDIDGRQRIGESALIPMLVKALQELSTELDAAKARITTLEG